MRRCSPNTSKTASGSSATASRVADFSVAITLPYADQAAMPLGEFPVVQRWLDRLNEIEAWREPFPRR